MIGSYDYRLVLLSLMVAFISSLAAFSLSAKVYCSEPKTAHLWLLGGAVAMGSGIWSMHFVGMLAFSLPIPLGYAFDYTTLSWLIAVATSWLALKIANQPELSKRLLVMGGLLMGAGISGMHYTGMYAMHMSPPITYNSILLLLSILIAIAASISALLILFWLRTQQMKHALMSKIWAAAVMSVAITGMHYTGMAAAEFAPNSICGAGTSAQPGLLAITTALGVSCLLLATFIVIVLDGHHVQSINLLLKDANYELNRMAMIDTLTKLPNRRALQQNLEAGTRRCLRTNSSMALAFIDLDNFKPINDNYGHHVGDELLVNVAHRLNSAVRNCDVVTRIGGDEFVALLEDIKSSEDIVPILERIVHSISEPFFINQNQLFISASVGVAVFPKDGNLDQLISCADAAMYRAKSDGKNQFRFFDTEIELASDHMLEMQKYLKHALANDEFKLQFQLKMGNASQMPVGAEALIRWDHPNKGLILPHSFLQEAERFGLICQINGWVIEEVCRTLHRMRLHGINIEISVNLAPQQFRNPNLAN